MGPFDTLTLHPGGLNTKFVHLINISQNLQSARKSKFMFKFRNFKVSMVLNVLLRAQFTVAVYLLMKRQQPGTYRSVLTFRAMMNVY